MPRIRESRYPAQAKRRRAKSGSALDLALLLMYLPRRKWSLLFMPTCSLPHVTYFINRPPHHSHKDSASNSSFITHNPSPLTLIQKKRYSPPWLPHLEYTKPKPTPYAEVSITRHHSRQASHTWISQTRDQGSTKEPTAS